MADEKTEETTKLSAKLAKIATEIEGLTALELSELAGYLEDVFGVSAMPAVAAAPVAAGAAEEAEEQSSYTVVLTEAGANKLAVIKAVREVQPDLGLMDAKKLVEAAPADILKDAKKEDAEAAQKKIADAGGKAELK